MSSSSEFDCYLCGAQNDATADHCARCNGQLLRIPSIDDDNSGAGTNDLPEEVPTEAEPETERKQNRKKLRKGTIQEQRLSDALGLPPELIDADEDPEDPLLETVVTSIPRATPSVDIPLLGTRAGVVPQAAMKDGEFGRTTYILLLLLVLATGWLAYSTITDSSGEPDSIAFTGTTTTSSTSTTTTEAPRNVLPENTILSLFRDTFVRVEIYECTSELARGVEREPVLETVGISIDTNNVLVGADNGGHDIAFIRPRLTGNGRVALLTRTDDGTIATSLRGTSDNLRLTAATDTPEKTHFVSFDVDSRQASIADSRQDAAAEIAVSDTGEAQTLFLDGRSVPAGAFIGFEKSIELIPDAEIPGNAEPCDALTYLRHVAAESPEMGEETENLTSTSTPEGNGTSGAAEEIEGE